jgi:hypothetical protein
MMFPVSDVKDDRRSTTPWEDRGVLVNLPRTRPQRASPRRAAARKATAGARTARSTPPRPVDRSAAPPSQTVMGAAAAAPAKRGAPPPEAVVGHGTPTSVRGAARKRARSAGTRPMDSGPRRDAAPRQGFESDSETLSGSVQPPGATELVASAVEMVGELAKVGLSTGERVLSDVLSRLPHS